MINKEILKLNIKNITTEKVNDKVLEKIMIFIKKYDKDIFNDDIIIYQNSLRFYFILCKNIMLKVYRNSNYFLNDYTAIKKLNDNDFKDIIKIIDLDDVNNIIVYDKVNLLGYERLGVKFINKSKIKEMIILILKTIFSLYTLNQQQNLHLNFSNIGIDKHGKFKIIDLSRSEYIDIENAYIAKELLFLSFHNFFESILLQVKYYNNKKLYSQMYTYMYNFKELFTDERIIYKPNLAEKIKKYTFFALKFIDFESFIKITKKW